jgi:hypothetical protein
MQAFYDARAGYLPPRFSLKQDHRDGVRLFEELQPKGALEERIAAHIVAVDNLLEQSLLKAALPNQRMLESDWHLNHALKAERLFRDLHATFEKLRGKNQQRYVVEHVHVAAPDQGHANNPNEKSPVHRAPPHQSNPAQWGDSGEIAPVGHSHPTVDASDDHERRRHPKM